jgi:transketolase
MPISRQHVLGLMKLATGDEKHDWSSISTVDPLMVLYGRVLRVDPRNPRWEQRDRFILSKGHGPTAYYAVLAACGFFPEDLLQTFMAYGSPLGAHPDRYLVPGVEASTGSLGHGLALAIGTALGLRAKDMVDQRVFCLTGDAELNEGSNWEAILLSPHLQLSNLTLLVIDNHTVELQGGAPRRQCLCEASEYRRSLCLLHGLVMAVSRVRCSLRVRKVPVVGWARGASTDG